MTNSEKNLIAITTCNRLSLIEKFVWDYIKFANKNPDFDLIISLDGTDHEYIEFCEKYGVNLIYSEEREGVGLSKNRVLKAFKNYKYYFFIEDDVELLNDGIFQLCIDTMTKLGIHHLCGNERHKVEKSITVNNDEIKCSLYGGGYFAVYSRKGLDIVGGWDTRFAEYKRFGHTEHTYRYVYSSLQEFPFMFPERASTFIVIHDPPSVTRSMNTNSFTYNEYGIMKEEAKLINEKRTYFPLRTLSDFNICKNSAHTVTEARLFNKKYPLSNRKERRISLAEHFALKIEKTDDTVSKISLFLKSFVLSPTNIGLKHYIKTKLFGSKR